MRIHRLFLIGIAFWLVSLMVLGYSAEAQTQKKKPATGKTPAKTTTTKPKTPAKAPAKAPAKKPAGNKQLASEPTIDASAGDEKKVRDIIAFLEFVLNTLGASDTPARDKEVVVTESYAKIFRDNKVQIEDDLDQTRNVITNKDVPAYLKDVDFFFTNVKFTFEIDGIQKGDIDGKQFYKVSLTRNLAGTSADGETVNNNSPRFVEMNYDPVSQDLKIVSIYTKGFDEKQAMLNWWSEMSYEWQALFRKKTGIEDSVGLAEIRTMSSITEMDLSNNKFIQSIEPLGRLNNLQKLNISGTTISDLVPVRNLTELVEVDVSNTPVSDVSVLKYASRLSILNAGDTDISDISVVRKMPLLATLDISGTKVSDLTPLSELVTLTTLDVSNTNVVSAAPLQPLVNMQLLDISATGISDVAPLTSMKTLSELSIDSTGVTDATPIAQLSNLTVLNISNTKIATLDPFKTLPKIQKIYCDLTPIKQPAADGFMAARPGTLVIYDSKDLKAWWESLSEGWKSLLYKNNSSGLPPSRDELARLTNVDSVNIASNTSITDLEPLQKMLKLKVIIANKTGIKDITPLKDHREIRVLDISDTEVADISVLSKFPRLEVLIADRTGIQDIDQIASLKSLTTVYADDTGVHDIHASDFLAKNPEVLLVYKTYHVERWWGRLAPEWKTPLEGQLKMGDKPTREKLHELVEQRALNLGAASVTELTSLGEFVHLEELKLSNTMLQDLSTLSNLSIRTLHITNSPLHTLNGIAALPDLRDLDISNTPISELKPMAKLNNLVKFSCAGTQVKKLDYLELLASLEYVDCSNTSVGKLDGVSDLPLKTLKCYNTKLSARQVTKFRESHPDCEVVFY